MQYRAYVIIIIYCVQYILFSRRPITEISYIYSITYIPIMRNYVRAKIDHFSTLYMLTCKYYYFDAIVTSSTLMQATVMYGTYMRL